MIKGQLGLMVMVWTCYDVVVGNSYSRKDLGGKKKKRIVGLMWSHIEKNLAETKNELEGVG